MDNVTQLARRASTALPMAATILLWVILVYMLLGVPVVVLFVSRHGFPGGPALSPSTWTDPNLYGGGIYVVGGLLLLITDVAFGIIAGAIDDCLDPVVRSVPKGRGCP